MEQPLNAHRSGTVKGLSAQVGASVTSGAPICEINDWTRTSDTVGHDCAATQES